MNKLPATLFLWVMMSAACTAPKIEYPTQTVVSSETLTQNPTTPDVSFVGDGGLITDQPCASPCFLGIQIGKTQLDQVVNFLESNGVSSCVQDTDNISCGSNIYIGTHTSTLVIDSIGYSPDISISIESVINKYDDPEIIQIFPGDIPESIEVSALLFWDSINMRISLPEIAEQAYLVENTTNAEWITFFDENLYSDLTASEYSQKWRGYGLYPHP